MKKETTYKLLTCIIVLFCTTFIFANDNDVFSTLDNNAYRVANDTIPECDDMICTNGVETWDPVTCECQSGIPPSPCSSCYNQEAGTTCDNGDSNTYNDTWQEVMPDVMRYRVQINITWDSLSPGWPDQNAHFSWMGGGTHNANVKFWEVGTLASPGIDMMSVNGVTNLLVSEVEAEIANGNAEHVIQEQHWFCPNGITHTNCGQLWFDIFVGRDFPLVTMASMLGPSPDWFIGTESLSVLDSNGVFIPQIIHELYPYDAGILSDNSVLESDCCEREPLSIPQQNIHLITEESGELIGPESLGQMIFTAFPDPLDCACVSDPAGDADNDGDGFPLAQDCDDTNASVNPDQLEVPYNGLDDDCNASSLDDDLDEDGFSLDLDCDDTNASVNPDQLEVPYNGLDDDCNTSSLDDDLDEDGFSLDLDCDDTNPAINPDQIEVPYNGLDDDCDTSSLDDDLDEDGFSIDLDCDDNNPLINPDAEEIPNNEIDEDCDGSDLMTSIHEIANTTINISPNPVSTYLQIQMNTPLDYQILIFDLNGQLLLKGVNQSLIDVGQFSTGIYILELIDNKTKQKIVEKIVVAK